MGGGGLRPCPLPGWFRKRRRDRPSSSKGAVSVSEDPAGTGSPFFVGAAVAFAWQACGVQVPVEIRDLARSELSRVDEIDRTERIEILFEQHGTELVARRGSWSASAWDPDGHGEHSVDAQRRSPMRHPRPDCPFGAERYPRSRDRFRRRGAARPRRSVELDDRGRASESYVTGLVRNGSVAGWRRRS
jgi:hypothetical protein